MTDTMEVLFQHAQSNAVPALLAADAEHRSGEKCAQLQEAALRAALNKHDAAKLDAMLEEMELARATELRAVFRAGFQLAMELAGR